MMGEAMLFAAKIRTSRKGNGMLLVLALLVVLIFFGIGFTAHFLWVVAAVLLVLWLAGMAIGRGESAGRHHFYRW
jgi:energy-coupling factor transporter transmembrane protein EcfT